MPDDRERLLARVRHLLERYVQPARFAPSLPVSLEVHHIDGEPVPYVDAAAGPWEPFAVGGSWGGTWGTSWFRVRGRIPEEWLGEEVNLRIDLGYHGAPGFGAEGLIWRDGTPFSGVNSRHQEVIIAAVSRGGEEVELLVEAAANPVGGGEDLLPADYAGPPHLRLERADLAVRNEEVDRLYLDFVILAELAADLAPGERRAGELLAALREACATLDTADVAGSAKAVRSVLARPLGRRAPVGAHRVTAVGHAHIDTAWLWPLRETVRKCARTFSTAVDLMGTYPEYRFACSQAQQHVWVRDRYPELFARIRQRVAEGRFEPVGSMWVEPDCNLPSGEALVRQFLYGKRFFLEAYGVETIDCWLPDAFGYPASLPQIMRGAGARMFISQKMSWNEVNRYPHHTFWWEGLDGTRVLAHFPPSDTYNGDFSVAEVRHAERDFADHGASSTSLYPFGYGDGGGGPTREMLERAARLRDLDGLPKVTIESVRTFLDRLEADAANLESWVGELYLEYHRGTYTSQARVKAGNRRGEVALYEAELWSVLADAPPSTYPKAELEEAWKSLLTNQFHDILPGSSINWVIRDAADAHRQVAETAGRVRANAEAAIVASIDTSWAEHPVVVTNACSHRRREVIALPESVAGLNAEEITGAVVDTHGTTGAFQRAADGRLLAAIEVPACGWVTYDVCPGRGGSSPTDSRGDTVTATPSLLENELLRVELDANGLIVSIFDKRADREVVAIGERANMLCLHDDEPVRYDAWDIDEFNRDRIQVLDDLESVHVVEVGPLRAGIRVRRRFDHSQITQVIRLHAGSARLDFDTEVDWHHRHRLLKVAFPVAVRSTHASFEIQFGHVERATHSNTSWDKARFEVCAHHWADLSEPGYGVALLNDSKYGYRVEGHTFELSLLRSPTAPDPEADQGTHRFSYALLPHIGDLREGGVVDEGHAFNTPLHVLEPRPSRGERSPVASLVSFDRPGVVLAALKTAEDGDDLILRCYEAYGSRGPVRVTLGLPVVSATRADLLERPGASVDVRSDRDGASLEFDINPFELVTFRLEKALATA